MAEFIPLTCNLNEGGTVIFDVPYTEADDVEETFTLYDLFSSLVGA
jgi:hypothetical protein